MTSGVCLEHGDRDQNMATIDVFLMNYDLVTRASFTPKTLDFRVSSLFDCRLVCRLFGLNRRIRKHMIAFCVHWLQSDRDFQSCFPVNLPPCVTRGFIDSSVSLRSLFLLLGTVHVYHREIAMFDRLLALYKSESVKPFRRDLLVKLFRLDRLDIINVLDSNTNSRRYTSDALIVVLKQKWRLGVRHFRYAYTTDAVIAILTHIIRFNRVELVNDFMKCYATRWNGWDPCVGVGIGVRIWTAVDRIDRYELWHAFTAAKGRWFR